MQIMPKSLRPFVFALLLPLWGLAQQPHPILSSFDPFVQPNGILLKWVIIGGNQCQGTKIYRADNGGDFTQIGHIPGVCGSNVSDQTYTYFDSIPIGNSYNSYKLEMGFQGFTSVVTVFFEDFHGNGFVLLSDPASERYRILYSNELNQTAALEVYDRMGRRVYRDSDDRSDFSISTIGWRNGLYVFRVSNSEGINFRGKFYIGP